MVQEHIREVHESLPTGYYRELPETASGTLAGYPRVYELAITLISHSEARVDAENLGVFVAAFQEISPLSIGELWAVPAMLRLALIESVRRLALRTVQRMDAIESADAWAARIEGAGERGEGELVRTLAEFVDAPPRLVPAFVSRFLQRLRSTRGFSSSLERLEQWIGERAMSAEEAGARSTQHLALTQVMMANSITSLRMIAHLDWKRFVEGHSVMEAVLADDPSGFYARMTFATRDLYRHMVERIAKGTGLTEQIVARHAVDLARRDIDAGGTASFRSHVGYYLIDDGLEELERATGYRSRWAERVHRGVLRHPNVVFWGGILTLTAAALATLFWLAGPAARTAPLLLLALGFLPAVDIAVRVLHQLVTAFLPPRTLPKLDLQQKEGIPTEYRTAVVTPTLFGSVEAVSEALGNLEVQFLANREAHLHFAVLSDFTDSPTETREGDDAIIAAAEEGVRALNARYGHGTDDAFHLFHRPRRWNERQNVWMGWERKRGKLAEFNRFLRGDSPDAFVAIVGDVAPLRKARFVITLDADTVLPPDAAPLLVGTLAHPLNRAVYDATAGRVVRGYGILQPRVGVSLPSAHRTRFASIHSGHPGVDPYTTAVSDVYQDLYGEGSFTGKGIYDVDTFEEATHGRFPENTLLSHDLIEGNYARAGLATDINVYDDYPSRYLTYTRRKHRWIRGDWQLLQWLSPRVPGPDGPERNRLPLLARWKIADNLRRSTLEIALLLFLLGGWSVLPGSPLRWTLLGLGAIAAPWLVALLLAALRPPMDRSWRAYYAAIGRDAWTSAQQVGLAVTFLAHQAWVSADAIGRTLWRLFVSRRDLLEWQTASGVERAWSGEARDTWRAMAPAAVVAGGLAAVASLAGAWGATTAVQPWHFVAAVLPLVTLWAVSPLVAHALRAPALPSRRPLPEARHHEALRYALLHWRFFDRFVTADTQWLAPDNFQEDPVPVVAMRTSPTNIGLQLLATASAHDLGFITLPQMTRRLELAFRSLERMRRLRGHFLNWYDLNDLRVLEPGYVSTVDSGNLAGHLIALRQACLEVADSPLSDRGLSAALDAALALAEERLRALSAEERPDGPNVSVMEVARAHLIGVRAILGRDATVDSDSLLRLRGALDAASAALGGAGLGREAGEHADEWIRWSRRRIAEHVEWLGELGPAAASVTAEGDAAPSLRDLCGSSAVAGALVARIEALAERANRYAMEMDFRFLFDEDRELFAIGYRESSQSCDESYYDLLASESRLASFLAIAKNDVPTDHWFRLGRTLTRAAGSTALVSWSGSMFEYLMPALVMQSLPFTLLDQTCRSAVKRQIAYGAERAVPWGVSESAYNVRDRHFTYQYRAFGVPDLALKRGLGHDLVVAPYASALALAVEPEGALANLRTLEKKGALGPYGFREALDFTRPDPGERYAVVATYMAHHVGMGLVAIANALASQLWQRRFHADPTVRSAELLLHERIPRRLVLKETPDARPDEALPEPEVELPSAREYDTPDTRQPHVALLGRHPYTLMVSQSGGGYSRYEELAVTRWRADGTRDATGQFLYVKDVGAGRVWSAAHQPVCATADRYRALLGTDRVTFHRRDGDIETHTEVVVVPEEAAEVRRVTLTNHAREPREIEVTSYGEVVLGPLDADRAHPAFANLFIETEWHPWCEAITATRRPRSSTEAPVWCVHVVDSGGAERLGPVTCETDRGRFLGRGRSPRRPVALTVDGPLSGTVGPVLDPIFALRTRVRVEPGRTASVAFTTLVATTRERAFELADRYHDPHAAQRAFDLAWTSQQVELRELGLTPGDVATFQEIAGYLFYHRPGVRGSADEIRANRGSRALLWANGISGDLPIVLATIDSAEGLPTLRQLFAAHHYWRRRGMAVDLVVVDTQPSSYLQELRGGILEALFASNDSGLDRRGGVFPRQQDQIRSDELVMLKATARFSVHCDGRSLGRIVEAAVGSRGVDSRQPEVLDSPPRRLERRSQERSPARGPLAVNPLAPARAKSRVAQPEAPSATRNAHKLPTRDDPAHISLDNGFGGLTQEGDYLIRVQGGVLPPAPWANVIANPHGGVLVTERGAGFTWAGSSYFFRLTPWHNDPVSDPASEVLYLRDSETGELWSPTPALIRTDSTYTVRHGAGTSVFAHDHGDIATTLTIGMAEDAAVKLSVLRVTNGGSRPRRLTLTAYAEWALGAQREHAQHQVHTEFEKGRGAVFARNFFEPEFAGWVAFCAMSEPVTAHTCRRREFLGRNGSIEDPAALRLGGLSGTSAPGADPCAALQCDLELAADETREILVLLGAAQGEAEARALMDRYRGADQGAVGVGRSVSAWEARLSTVSVRTPDPAFDAMLNRWALYQSLSCRVWARSALYQSSGAYGFRDQLQDSMALVYAEPGIAREHILRAAARQFVEGDVQHWWHPESGRGVRTRFSDDLVWLAYVTDHYVRVTGDASVLEEQVPFLTMRALEPHEHELYDRPEVSAERASVYEHCLRALRRACTAGAHGLPLIGGGDWNDGMNRVGVEGRGESVWLAWFLVTNLRAFAALAASRGDEATATELGTRCDAYAAAVETHGWDGAWYRRAFFDDGTPLGSATSEECRIDSIAQSWSVISGAADPDRQGQAMRAFEEHLVRPDARLLMLLTPPFDRTARDPGYIKGYLPGVRENGAQYTHASLWAVLATAMRGDGDRAFELYQMLNPLTHALTPEAVETYRVEPYVVAADVYTAAGQLGRGGWTWYTGAASWMYRVGLEAILGFTRRGDTLLIDPSVPGDWSDFSIDYRFGSAVYQIVVHDPSVLRRVGAEVILDGRALGRPEIPLLDDGAAHEVVVRPRRG